MSETTRRITIPHTSWTTTFVWWQRRLTRPIRNYIVRRFFYSPPPPVLKGPQKWPFPPNPADLNRFMVEGELNHCIPRLWKHEPSGWDMTVVAPPLAVRKDARETKRLIMYLYGGGFQARISKFHWGYIGYLSRELDAEIVVIPYPLCPANNVKDIMPALLQIYAAVLGLAAGREVIIMGDSSGAQIALCLAFAASDGGMALPAQLVAISPGTNLTPNPDMYPIAPYDLVLTPEYCYKAVRLWAGIPIPPDDAAHPGRVPIPPEILNNSHINPMAGDLSMFAKAGTKLILVSGTWDVLHADILLFADKAEQAGVEMTFIQGEHQFHCFPIAIDVAPECAQASRSIVRQIISNGVGRYVQR